MVWPVRGIGWGSNAVASKGYWMGFKCRGQQGVLDGVQMVWPARGIGWGSNGVASKGYWIGFKWCGQ